MRPRGVLSCSRGATAAIISTIRIATVAVLQKLYAIAEFKAALAISPMEEDG
ncbi:MAG TPA: hypothetical protein VNE63_06095 [Candidatus Acidoferrales bacterium]|nr:hypothetical protein [Candidatus Acidoferrales bacterium]